MSLDPGDVQATIRSLKDKHLVRVEENFKSQVEKYTQRFCNTPFSDHQFDEEEFAIICVLLLRGPRTPGELKANVGRLHRFADNGEVEAALKRLLEPEEGSAVVVQLPRTPGRRDNEYMHLFSGPLEAARAGRAAASPSASSARPQQTGSSTGLEDRVAALEAEVAALKAELSRLRDALGD